MNKEYGFHGTEIPEEEQERVKKHFEEMRDARRSQYEEEPKTDEELAMLASINSFLAEEYPAASSDTAVDFLPANHLVVLSEDSFIKMAEENGLNPDSTIGLALAYGDTAYVARTFDKVPLSRLEYFDNLMHEGMHLASYHKIQGIINPATKETQFAPLRSGYNGSGGGGFRAFNEAVISRKTREIVFKHKDEITQKFDISNEEWDNYTNDPGYKFNLEVLDIIITKVAASKNESRDIVWKRISDGLFSGEMMHLRDIEDTFGKGSLRFLSAFDEETRKLWFGMTDEYFKTYFETDNPKERRLIASVLLKDEQKQKYKQRRKNV